MAFIRLVLTLSIQIVLIVAFAIAMTWLSDWMWPAPIP